MPVESVGASESALRNRDVAEEVLLSAVRHLNGADPIGVHRARRGVHLPPVGGCRVAASRIGSPMSEYIARVYGNPRVNVRPKTWAQKGPVPSARTANG